MDKTKTVTPVREPNAWLQEHTGLTHEAQPKFTWSEVVALLEAYRR